MSDGGWMWCAVRWPHTQHISLGSCRCLCTCSCSVSSCNMPLLSVLIDLASYSPSPIPTVFRFLNIGNVVMASSNRHNNYIITRTHVHCTCKASCTLHTWAPCMCTSIHCIYSYCTHALHAHTHANTASCMNTQWQKSNLIRNCNFCFLWQKQTSREFRKAHGNLHEIIMQIPVLLLHSLDPRPSI